MSPVPAVLTPRQLHHAPSSGVPSPEVIGLLQHLHCYPQTTKSDLTREHADLFGEAASRDWITTEVVPGSKIFGRIWKVTILGLYELKQWAHLIQAEELAAFFEEPQGRFHRGQAAADQTTGADIEE